MGIIINSDVLNFLFWSLEIFISVQYVFQEHGFLVVIV